MAQRTEKEETEFKPLPETLSLCINNCGLIGSPSTNNMCQNCFNSSTTLQRNRTVSSSVTSTTRKVDKVLDDQLDDIIIIKSKEVVVVNRCSGCRKKVGLTGFRCRCGDMFCWEHRYSDRHDCSYDYKGVGREMIAKDNPVVKAPKIVRI